MPQMAPISWLLLFFIFTITFIMFNIMNFYIFFYKSSQSMSYSLQSNKSFNWKW